MKASESVQGKEFTITGIVKINIDVEGRTTLDFSSNNVNLAGEIKRKPILQSIVGEVLNEGWIAWWPTALLYSPSLNFNFPNLD